MPGEGHSLPGPRICLAARLPLATRGLISLAPTGTSPSCLPQRWKGRRTFFRLLGFASPLGAAPSVFGGVAAAPGGGGWDGLKKPPLDIGPGLPWKMRLKKSCRSAAEAGLPFEEALGREQSSQAQHRGRGIRVDVGSPRLHPNLPLRHSTVIGEAGPLLGSLGPDTFSSVHTSP